jgi:hypothetical protein
VGFAILVVAAFCYYPDMRQVREPLDARRALEVHARTKLSDPGNTYAQEDEFRPRTARVRPAVGRCESPMVTGEGIDARPLEGSSPHHIRVLVRAGSTGGTVTVQQLYFPGWRVRLDGQPVPEARLRDGLLPDGRMRVRLPDAAEHLVEAWYDGPPGWRWRSVGVGVVTAGSAAFVAWRWRRRRWKARQGSAIPPVATERRGS